MDIGAAKSVAVIGLGSMGYGMAKSLRRRGLRVIGFDVAAANLQRWRDEGGLASASAADAVVDADVVVCVVVSAAQTETVLFGPDGIAERMPKGSVFLGCATADPEIVRRIAARLERTGRLYLDAPISGGATRSSEGTLTIMA